MRVVSLVPSVTETLLAWDVVPIAVTRFCEQPELAARRRHEGSRRRRIVALAPDLVVVNDEENRKEDFDALEAAGLAVHVVRVTRVEDVAPALATLARVVGIAFDAAPLPPALPERMRAFVPIWRRPWMTMNADTYGSSVLAHLGVANVFASAGERYPEVDARRRARRRRRARADRALSLRPAARGRAAHGRAGHLRRRPGPLLVGRAHAGRARAAGEALTRL